MANRPVYVPIVDKDYAGVSIKDIEFKWFPGMAKSQKQKSITSLHSAAFNLEIEPILEISSKSKDQVGVDLSAFNLMIKTQKYSRSFSVETAFQASKVFEKGGPFVDLLNEPSIKAKKDIRLKESGNIVKFSFFNEDFPLHPRTFFYDWIYIKALCQDERLSNKIVRYSGFTDIEFNPKISINCQAYSAALYVSLKKNNLLDDAIKSKDQFLQVLNCEYRITKNKPFVQGQLIW